MPKTPGEPNSGSSGLDQDDITTHPDLFNADDTDAVLVTDDTGHVVAQKEKGWETFDPLADVPATYSSLAWELTKGASSLLVDAAKTTGNKVAEVLDGGKTDKMRRLKAEKARKEENEKNLLKGKEKIEEARRNRVKIVVAPGVFDELNKAQYATANILEICEEKGLSQGKTLVALTAGLKKEGFSKDTIGKILETYVPAVEAEELILASEDVIAAGKTRLDRLKAEGGLSNLKEMGSKIVKFLDDHGVASEEIFNLLKTDSMDEQFLSELKEIVETNIEAPKAPETEEAKVIKRLADACRGVVNEKICGAIEATEDPREALGIAFAALAQAGKNPETFLIDAGILKKVEQPQEVKEEQKTAPEEKRKLDVAPRKRAKGSVLLEKAAIGAPLVGLALAGLGTYMTFRAVKAGTRTAFEGGKELLGGTANTLLQTGETLVVNPFKIVGRVISTPFVRAADYWRKGTQYPAEPQAEGEKKPGILSRIWYRTKQGALGTAGVVGGLLQGAVEGPAVAIAKDVAGVQWKKEKEGEEEKTKVSFDHGGVMGIGAALLNTVKGTLYDGPVRALSRKDEPSAPEGGGGQTEGASGHMSTPEFLGDLTRAVKSFWAIAKADNASDNDIEGAIDNAVDLLNLERYGAVWALAGTGLIGLKKLLWPTIKPVEIHWESFGDQVEQLSEKTDIEGFLKSLDMRTLKRKFRLLFDEERLDAALQNEGGRKEAKKELGIFIGRTDEDIDMQELEHDLKMMLEKIGNSQDLAKAVRENHAALVEAINMVYQTITKARLDAMHEEEVDALPSIDYDQFGDHIMEKVTETKSSKEKFLAVFNPETIRLQYKHLLNAKYLKPAILVQREAAQKLIMAFFDLEEIFDKEDLEQKTTVLLEKVGDPQAFNNSEIRSKCIEARKLITQAKESVLESGFFETGEAQEEKQAA